MQSWKLRGPVRSRRRERPVSLHCNVNGGNAGERRRTQVTEGTVPQTEGVAGTRQGAFKNFMQTSDITRFVL